MNERTPLYVRLPAEQAKRLDRAAFELGASKQDLVAGLVGRHVDASTPAGRRALRELVTGRHEFAPSAEPDPEREVLDLSEAAALLRVDEAVIRAAAEAGEIPARRLGDQWRLSRRALLAWLGGTAAPPPAAGGSAAPPDATP
ncbi:MAG: helix-turn-helix domain-containing protein [Thermoleophilia bacterium]